MTRTLKTLETGFEIVDVIQEKEGARVIEIAEELDMTPGTVHSYLSTLTEQRYVVKEDETYHVGMRFLHVGGYARRRKEEYELAEQIVKNIANEAKERAQFVIEECGRGMYLYTESEGPAVQTDTRIGKEVYLHSNAGGKAILAHLPEKRIDEIIEQWGLPQFNENTLTTRDALFEELERIREQGYSINNEESITGLRAVGVPVRYPDDRILGALSVTGPSNRLQNDTLYEEILNLLMGTANEMELKISYL